MKITIDFEYPDTIYMSEIPRFNNRFKEIVRELLYTNGINQNKIDKIIESTAVDYE